MADDIDDLFEISDEEWQASTPPTYPLPSAEDFKMLSELDTFNSKVSAAISYLSKRGYSDVTIGMLLSQHLDPGTGVPSPMTHQAVGHMGPYVGRAVMSSEESQTDRALLRSRLVEAEILNSEDDHAVLRRKISDARAFWRRFVAKPKPRRLSAEECEAMHRREHDNASAGYLEAFNLYGRLCRIGIYLVRTDVVEIHPDASEMKSDASELVADASGTKSDG